VLLEQLQIPAPQVAIVEVDAEFLAAHEEVCLQFHMGRRAFRPGRQFGSQFPGDPRTEAVYDYLPDSLLRQVVNVGDFRGALVFDRWVANSDSRQAIFFRRRLREWLPVTEPHPTQKGFIAQMVDHGYAFDGPHWAYHDSPLQGLYCRTMVYEGVRHLGDFEPWLERVRHCPEELCDELLRRIPGEWLEGEEKEYERLLEQLMKRRKKVDRLIEATVGAKRQFFPAWQ